MSLERVPEFNTYGGLFIMKKLVLSAIAVAALSSTAMANKKGDALAPSLKISGNTIMNVYAVNQHHHNNGKGVALHFANDVSDLFFLVAGRTASGIEYKYKINFQAYSNASPVVDQNYVEFNTKWGTVQFGNVVGPEDSMVEDAGAIVGGTGAFDGSYYKVFNFSAFSMRGDDNIGDTGYATKVVYYSPELWNFRFGAAYTPDTTHLGDEHLNTNSIKHNPHVPGQRHFWPKTAKGVAVIGLHNWAFGLSYKKEWNNWGINLNGAYINEDSYLHATQAGVARKKLHHTSAYQLGTIVGYRRACGHLIQVAGGYLNNGHSRGLKHDMVTRAMNPAAHHFAENYGFSSTGDGTGILAHGNSGQAYNVGAAYTMGAYKFAGSFQNMERSTGRGKARTRVYSATADVIPVAGLKFYGEVDYVRTNSNNNAVNTWNSNLDGGFQDLDHKANRRNCGTVFILGTKVSF